MNQHLTVFQQRLDQRRSRGNYRELTAARIGCVDFASNDYLGFLRDGILDEIMSKCHERQSCGAGGSRLLTGHSRYYEMLEADIACFHQEEAGLIFNSGYVANLSLLPAVTAPGDTIIYDQEVHASLHDAVKLARVRAFPFRHQDLGHLSRRLEQARGRVFVCIESVYSCDGSLADLPEVHRLCQQAGAHLIVDEAHATGWLGAKGEGAIQMHGLQGKVFARVHTFSKALGGQGAIVLGSALLREYLINFARPFIYTTALPRYSLAVIRCAYQALEACAGKREQVQKLIHYFRKKARERSLSFEDSTTVIQCLRIPGNEAVKKAAGKLQQKGFDVRPFLRPTVGRGKECLRICLHAFNTEEEIHTLLESIS